MVAFVPLFQSQSYKLFRIHVFFPSFYLWSGEFHMGYTRNELQGVSWYHLLHWDSMREAQTKHRLSKCRFITIDIIKKSPKPSEWMSILLAFKNFYADDFSMSHA